MQSGRNHHGGITECILVLFAALEALKIRLKKKFCQSCSALSRIAFDRLSK